MSDSIQNMIKNINESQSITNSINGKSKSNYDENIRNRFSWLIIGVIIIIVAVSSFVIIFNVVNGQSFAIDVATILSTLLAFFSIFLSSIFYFKATEQSNKFYDRSYNHTRDIAKTLSLMEGKFSEALRNLENYSDRINRRFDALPLINVSEQEQILNQVLDNLNDLSEKIKRGNLSDVEFDEYLKKFKELKDDNEQLRQKLNNEIIINASSLSYLLNKIIVWGIDEKNMDFRIIQGELKEDFNYGYLDKNIKADLMKYEIINGLGDLTNKGKEFLISLKNNYLKNK